MRWAAVQLGGEPDRIVDCDADSWRQGLGEEVGFPHRIPVVAMRSALGGTHPQTGGKRVSTSCLVSRLGVIFENGYGRGPGMSRVSRGEHRR
jgi:hypothetical protein